MSDMTRREFTALIGDLAGARAEIERSRRFAPRGEWTQYASRDPLRIAPRMPGAARGIPSA